MFISYFSKRPMLRHVTHAERHRLGIDRRISEEPFGTAPVGHDLDFTYVGDRKPRPSIVRAIRKTYRYLTGKRRWRS